MDADLLKQRKQGRHRYFELADADVGGVLESLMGLAAKKGLLRTTTGPKDQALRKARVCYNHLAGELGVGFYENMRTKGYLKESGDDVILTQPGKEFVASFGISLTNLTKSRRPLCKACLDWSSRRTHLAGALGSAFLQKFYELKWAKPVEGSRVVKFTARGESNLHHLFKN